MSEALPFQFYRETRFKEVKLNGRKVRIPEGWKIVELGSLLDLRNGKRPVFSEKGTIPVYGANGIMGYTDVPLVQGDKVLIIGRVGASGEVHIAEGSVWVSDNAMYSTKIKSELVNIEYLEKLLRFIDIKKLATKNVHPLITKKTLMPLKIPLPPLPEQKKIVDVLGTIDNAIGTVDESIAKLEKLKKGVMKTLLTRGIGHKKFKEVKLNGRKTEIPEEWEVVELGDVAERRSETVNPNAIESLPFVGLEHIEPGKIKLTQWGKSTEVKSSKSKFYPGDILYGKLRPYLDKAVIAEFEGICSTDIIVIKAKSDNLLPEYLIWLVHTKDFVGYAKRTMKGVNHPRTSWKSLKKFQFALPPISEQKKIAEVLCSIDEAIEAKRQKKEKLERMKKAVMEKLLTGEVRIQ